MTYYAGQDIKVTLTAVDAAGAPAEPVGVRFILRRTGADSMTYVLGTDSEVSEEVTGSTYAFVFDAPTAGRYNIRAETLDIAGNAVGVAELAILVNASRVS